MANQLQLKITLKGSKPPIWRRIVIKDNISFRALHSIIQKTMGWYNCHLYQFDIGGLYLGKPFDDMFDDIEDDSRIKVNRYLNEKGDKITYTYDFGDGWDHLITVEAVAPLDKKQDYPRCIKGKGNCPPEDCGGIWGYYEMLEALKNKKHPNHEDMMEWVGGDFDPDKFDLEEINEMLKNHR